MWGFVFFLFLAIAVLWIGVMAPLAALLGVGWALYKIVSRDWSDGKKVIEGLQMIALLSVVLVIALVAYSYLGKWGAIAAFFLMSPYLIWD